MIVAPEVDIQLLAKVAIESQKCAEHPFYAIERGYVLTEDEKRGGETRPMPALPYLRIMTDLFMKYPIGIIFKSRQMMASWLFCWIVLWTAKFKPGSLSIMQGKRLDDVKAVGTKSLMGRMLFIHNHLPAFLRSAGEALEQEKKTKEARTLTSLVIPGGGVVVASPQGPDVIRSKTATTVVMDELPHHPEGLEAWTAALPTVDGADQSYSQARLWGIGTPNGRDPLCFEMAPWEKWREWDEKTGYEYVDGAGEVQGLRVYLKHREYEGYTLPPICCVRLHYTAEYDPAAWARRRATRAAYPSEGAYEREHEISFKTVAGMAVFGESEFTSSHLEKWEPDVTRPLVISMDLGYQGTSAAFWQESTVRLAGRYWKRHHLWFHKLWRQTTLQDVLFEIKGILVRQGFNWQSARWIADYNSLNTHHGGAGITDFEIYYQHNIVPEARRVGPHQVDQGINLIRRALKPLPDGRPGLLVDPDGAPLVVQMFDGGYRYDDPADGKGYTETPLKDGTYDHIADSVRYRFWADPGAIFDASDDVSADQPMPGQTSYVRQYLKKKKRSHQNTELGVGPSGALRGDR